MELLDRILGLSIGKVGLIKNDSILRGCCHLVVMRGRLVNLPRLTIGICEHCGVRERRGGVECSVSIGRRAGIGVVVGVGSTGVVGHNLLFASFARSRGARRCAS